MFGSLVPAWHLWSSKTSPCRSLQSPVHTPKTPVPPSSQPKWLFVHCETPPCIIHQSPGHKTPVPPCSQPKWLFVEVYTVDFMRKWLLLVDLGTILGPKCVGMWSFQPFSWQDTCGRSRCTSGWRLGRGNLSYLPSCSAVSFCRDIGWGFAGCLPKYALPRVFLLHQLYPSPTSCHPGPIHCLATCRMDGHRHPEILPCPFRRMVSGCSHWCSFKGRMHMIWIPVRNNASVKNCHRYHKHETP